MKKVRRTDAGHAGMVDALEIAGMRGDTRQIASQLAKDICNIVFMDIDIPGMTAIEIASIVKAAYPDINVILLSIHEGKEEVKQVVQGGNTQKIPPVSLSEFISQVYEAAVQSNMIAVEKVLAFFNRRAAHRPPVDSYGLSSRELEVLSRLVSGDTYKKIAEHCHISVGTVRSHIMNIYRKLEVNTRSAAIVKALKERLVRGL
ncbi:response regulator transcription factor [Chitinophaga pendula]|uniref:response regulator transcription factor n=1 Tax=Chitinophaga TaxID=79328 RepID=UPI000BAE948C|nr:MULTISPECIES: response regulator transcription factor [Chitinophaga]ASZ11059.1 hypothetical protein CK934_08845 [Chitinophaga sp. MD30]UCJ05943.1 response regulator transcription factor [Chitinophaga pendula]